MEETMQEKMEREIRESMERLYPKAPDHLYSRMQVEFYSCNYENTLRLADTTSKSVSANFLQNPFPICHILSNS